jgi:EpsI family protein
MILLRSGVAALLLLSGIVATHDLKPTPGSGLQRPLHEFPRIIGSDDSEDLPYDDDIVRAIGADEYINRKYFGNDRSLELYVGYYKDQRSGDMIHSPKNCLPGTGWEPVRSGQLAIGSLNGAPVLVNEYIVEKGSDRDLVLYWYQTHGRVVASEYSAKFWLVADGLRHRSTDGAMIRIWTTAADGDANARLRAKLFAQRVYPQLAAFLSN